MDGDRAVRSFVRGVLGCACDDRVFDRIERRDALLPEGQRCLEWVIGERLLVRAMGPVSASTLRARLGAWIVDGVYEREARRLNRFRLVVYGPDRDSLEAAARRELAAGVLPDGKAHLHVIAQDDLRDLL